MENEDLQQPEPGNIRLSTNISFKSSEFSLVDMTSEDFYEHCKARLKVSKRNTALLLKIKY